MRAEEDPEPTAYGMRFAAGPPPPDPAEMAKIRPPPSATSFTLPAYRPGGPGSFDRGCDEGNALSSRLAGTLRLSQGSSSEHSWPYLAQACRLELERCEEAASAGRPSDSEG